MIKKCERQNIKRTIYKKVAKLRNNTYRIKKIDSASANT